jgi:PD-(D/E)XK nuclease superfamily protein
MNDEQSIKDFIDNFKDKYSSLEDSKIESDKNKYNNLFYGWSSLNSLIKSYEKEIASDYNIFYILKNINEKEVITHSPILADLLNVNGQHMQGDLFYKEFLKQLEIENINDFMFNDEIYFKVETEKWTGDGSIDIFISYYETNKRFVIAIENKRGAKDQDKQLERYYKYLKNVHKSNFLLIYLTPYGNDPEEYSISSKLLKTLKDDNIIKIISYNRHIKNVLENTINNIKAEKVRSLINQYMQII